MSGSASPLASQWASALRGQPSPHTRCQPARTSPTCTCACIPPHLDPGEGEVELLLAHARLALCLCHRCRSSTHVADGPPLLLLKLLPAAHARPAADTLLQAACLHHHGC
jgi:hypothetical protein